MVFQLFGVPINLLVFFIAKQKPMNSEICTKKYYVYDEICVGTDIVKKFIQHMSHVLVGGQSIDYALRLKGVKLYEDWEIPDLDFLTDDYANVSYEIFKKIATKLSDRVNISVVNAVHPTTMRVQVAKFSVADVTFVPTRLLEMYKKSALVYDGCLIRHPYFQYIDIQRSFSYPYENPMMEVVVHRWKKDFDRFLLLMDHYSPSDKFLVGDFVTKYQLKTKPNLSILGMKKNRLHKRMMSKKLTGSSEVKTENLVKLYKTLSSASTDKELLTIGVINGELAFGLYLEIYNKIFNKTENQILISKDGKTYKGSNYFLNSYLFTHEDKDRFFVDHASLMEDIRETNPYIDVIPQRTITGEWEFINIDHRTAYNDINLSLINPKYPKLTVKVVSVNFLITYISMLWITLRVDLYLSMFLKLLRMLNKVYRLKEDTPLIRLLYPSITTYGSELPHVFDINRDKFSKPANVYTNKYVNLNEALAQIKEYEYPEIYNLDGM